MAQQTRLETMFRYYKRWLKRFPTIEALANSNEQDVLAIWEGLGYYTRARNLHRAARLVLAQHNGQLPDDVSTLLTLPGIGPYTAGAIASIAFGRDEPAVDGNAMRVLARVFNVRWPIDSNRTAKRFRALAMEHLPTSKAAEYNQALMDLGAGICRPRHPDCPACPLRRECRSLSLGIQEKRPVKKVVTAVPQRYFVAAVIMQRGQVFLSQRPAKGLLGGMWEFPNAMIKDPSRARSALRRELEKIMNIDLQFIQKLGHYEHAYSHFHAHLQVFGVKLNGRRPKVASAVAHRWLSVNRLSELPMGKLDRQIAQALRDNAK